MKRTLLLLTFLLFTAMGAYSQTVQDSGYRTIGHAQGIPMEWAALYFFFGSLLR